MKLPLGINSLLTRLYLRRHGVRWHGELPEMDMLRPPQFLIYGKLILGTGVKFFTDLGPTRIQVDKGATITIGSHTVINGLVWIRATTKIKIQKHVLIAKGVNIIDCDMHPISPSKRVESKPVFIGENTWFGLNTIILPGVHVGKNSVVGAGSVVRHCVPENKVFAGNPAREIGSIEDLPEDWYRMEY